MHLVDYNVHLQYIDYMIRKTTKRNDKNLIKIS